MSRSNRQMFGIILAIVLVSLACGVPSLGQPSISTQPPGWINTVVALTAAAAQTQTAAVLPPPSATLEPTFTPTVTAISPTETLTPTPTIIFEVITLTPTRTATSSVGDEKYSCVVTSQSPADGATIKAKQDFDAVWKVKNVGKEDWDAASIDLVFVSGKNMAGVNGRDINNDVASGKSIKLVVDMTAPAKKGTYTSTWALKKGGNEFCTLSVNIVVP